MKKYLIFLFALSYTIFGQAQIHTYINNGAVVKVEENTLLYNTNDLFLNTTDPNKVLNEGNVRTGGFKKGTAITGQMTGGEFVNVWTDTAPAGTSKYGQLIITGTDAQTTAKMTQQKKAVSSASINWYPIGIPFQGTVKDFMAAYTTFGNPSFRGECPVNTFCGNRYYQTMMIWDNEQIENDAVLSNTAVKPGQYYLLNLAMASTGLKAIYNSSNIIPYKGLPAPSTQNIAAGEGFPRGSTVADFGGLNYAQWKDRTNYYSETYESYLGVRTDAASLYRFGKICFVSEILIHLISI